MTDDCVCPFCNWNMERITDGIWIDVFECSLCDLRVSQTKAKPTVVNL